MTTRKKTTPQTSVVAELIKSKLEFSTELSERISIGKALYAKPLNNDNEYSSQQREYNKWTDYNAELLKQSFDKLENEYVYNYVNAGDWTGMVVSSIYERRNPFQDYAAFKTKLEDKIENLESLLQKVNLLKTSFAEIPTKTTYSELDTESVFIVHGHDEFAKTEVARFLEKLNLKAIILHEQASSGDTIIEKIERHTNVGFGIVLYTQCDVGAKVGNETNLQFRARQNVVFEHGFLIGKIGRQNVCALVKGNIETPNDISGVVYIQMDTNWKWQVAKELRASGYLIDMNLI